MSYGLTAYALDTDGIRQLGGAEAALLPRVAASAPVTGAMDRIHRLHGTDHPTAEELIGRIARGEAADDVSRDAVYVIVFRALCELYGDPLANSAWYPIGPTFPDLVQSELDRLGVPRDLVDVTSMMHSGAPLPLPPNADLPVIGHLPQPRVEQALTAVDALDLATVADRPVRDAIAQLAGWLRACTNLLPRDLVCVYS